MSLRTCDRREPANASEPTLVRCGQWYQMVTVLTGRVIVTVPVEGWSPIQSLPCTGVTPIQVTTGRAAPAVTEGNQRACEPANASEPARAGVTLLPTACGEERGLSRRQSVPSFGCSSVAGPVVGFPLSWRGACHSVAVTGCVVCPQLAGACSQWFQCWLVVWVGYPAVLVVGD